MRIILLKVELVQQVGFWLLGPWLRRVARQQADESRWKKMLYYSGINRVKNWRFKLGVTNRFCGYAFLVDMEGLVRWRAVGVAEPREIEAMLRHTKKLASVKRLEAKK